MNLSAIQFVIIPIGFYSNNVINFVAN